MAAKRKNKKVKKCCKCGSTEQGNLLIHIVSRLTNEPVIVCADCVAAE